MTRPQTLLDDNLYPPAYNCRQGTYRGQRTPTFTPRTFSTCITRTVTKTGNGWFKGLLSEDYYVVNETRSFRTRQAAWDALIAGEYRD